MNSGLLSEFGGSEEYAIVQASNGNQHRFIGRSQ